MKNVNYKDLTSEQQKLLLEALKAIRNAYNPYSKFSVGAALLSKTKKMITGANFENAAYGPSICAERAALVRANSMGVRKFSKIAIIARGSNGATLSPTAPCGTCRQVIFEASQVSGIDIEVIMSNTNMTKIIISTISELLPLAFGPNDLGMDASRF